MRTNIISFPMDLQYPIEKYDLLENLLFFDIETTGFSPDSSFVYLIGCIIYSKETHDFQVTQWFAESKQEENILLHTFFDFAKDYNTLVHYNGQGFDMPYLSKKCRSYNLPYGFSNFSSLDLYRCIAQYKKLLKLPQMKQKSIEEFLEIYRDDPFSGGELISVYEAYLAHPDNQEHYQKLIQHNLDDLRCMVRILPILSYSDFFQGGFSITGYTQSKKEHEENRGEIIFEIEPEISLPKRISFGNQEFYFTGFKNRCKLKVRLYTGELKYFYPNYKDYYYLPEEDTSIHKSVAFYVDKDFRTQAKAANCYSRKTGQFLPQYEEIVTPYFKREYKDKMTYFELTEEFIINSGLLQQYILHIFRYLS